MNKVVNISPRTVPLTAALLQSARELASMHNREGNDGTAIALNSLVAEVETLREAAKGALIIVNQACATASLAQLRASVLLIIAEKLAPVLDRELEWDCRADNEEEAALLQGLSDELHAAIRLAKG
jgi:hypothetical protein